MRIDATSVALGLAAGLLVGGAVGVALSLPTGLPAAAPAEDAPDPENPPRGYSTGTGCIAPEAAGTGWVHEVADGPGRDLTANLTVPHGANETVGVTFATTGAGEYRLRIDVVPAADAKSGTPDCTAGSTVAFGATLPTDYEALVVVVDGDPVATVRNDGNTTPDLVRLSWGSGTEPDRRTVVAEA